MAEDQQGGAWAYKSRNEKKRGQTSRQGCISRLTCSHPELTKDHVLTSAYEVPLLEIHHVLATIGKSCSKEKSAFAQIIKGENVILGDFWG